MPIRPENQPRYPAHWRSTIVPRIRKRSGGRCECTGQCGSPRCITRHGETRCTAVHLTPHPVTGSKVVLTVAHFNHTPEDVRDVNLADWCQLCHLAYDRHLHEANRRRNRLAAQQRGMNSLFNLDGA